MKRIFSHVLFLLLMSYTTPASSYVPIHIPARDLEHTPLYRMRVPNHWTVHLPKIDDSLEDTTIPLCTCAVEDVEITIHNFDLKISPNAQTARWKRQFDSLTQEGTNSTPQAFSGFIGLKFTGKGIIKGKETEILAWAMQLSPDLLRTLNHPRYSKEIKNHDLMAKDFTIKAIGSPMSIDKHRKEIIAAARSFELIEAIPYRP